MLVDTVVHQRRFVTYGDSCPAKVHERQQNLAKYSWLQYPPRVMSLQLAKNGLSVQSSRTANSVSKVDTGLRIPFSIGIESRNTKEGSIEFSHL